MASATILKAQGGQLLYSDNFTRPLNTANWIIEMEPAPNSGVYTQNGALVLNTRKGVTVWFSQRLKGNIRIEYDRRVLVDTGKNDRLSDFNQFWGAADPNNASLFSRKGKLEDYDALSLYYIGMGGNTNKTTRFRKYLGDGTKPLIQEYTDAAHLLQANKSYHISIIVKDGTTSYWVDGQCYFTYADAKLLNDGYFGFRSTWSRQEVKNFRVYRL
ncbi:methyltransferase [Mucilaginibacter sp. PPCGB 2223]|nr:methyltransferase [Mucilaginibacter sp. PPCGB 2223]